ncbi:TetR/AcrR family transcriptional regulator [Desulfitobacterium sp. Sab5]|uniref:TetR/AcrR family transcriptional regulator n=1 Tax=Desulfitobacterium nosdiversum TaxID=3375356 RepID=UPI003CF2E59A
MDRRTEKTKDAIYNAFSSLLLKKRYSKITIQEIIDYANIGRSTFYSHFETKDELLKAMCTDIIENIHSSNLSLDNATPCSIIVPILYHIKGNQKIIRGVFSSNSSELLTTYFKRYLNSRIEQYFLFSYNETQTGIPKNFLINHISGSFIEMIKWWSDNNMEESPEELSGYFISVISPIINLSYKQIHNA